MSKYYMTWNEVFERLENVLHPYQVGGHVPSVYGVPRGGMLVAGFAEGVEHVTDPIHASVILDDIIDSGRTMRQHREQYPDLPFVALVVNRTRKADADLGWVVFPWEKDVETSQEDIVVRMLQAIGEDVEREGLRDTPARVIRSWEELYSGYGKKVEDVFKVFVDGACDEMVVLRDIEFYSMCEHHTLPFFGKAHIAYIPDGKVIGVSKLARLLDVFARRLQIQERIGEQVTTALMTHLRPKGAACVIEAQHLCMKSRGVQKQDSVMVTSSLKGVFMEHATRAEFFTLIRGRA